MDINPYSYEGWEKKLLESYPIEKLKKILFEHDTWNHSWEESEEEREKLNQENKDEIIDWILSCEFSSLFIHCMIEEEKMNDVAIDSNGNLIITKRRQNMFMVNKPRRVLEAASLPNLKFVLFNHDVWFSSWEDLKDERSKINQNNKEEIIDWICDTDPIFEDGGLLSFIDEMIEKLILIEPYGVPKEFL